MVIITHPTAGTLKRRVMPIWMILKRMQDILKDKRAETMSEALEVLKNDLKALNSSVVVEQEEYDEIVAIKPMFLVMDYK